MEARKKSRSLPKNRGKYAQAGKRFVNLLFLLIFFCPLVGLVKEHIEIIRQKYKRHEGWLAPFPWCEDFQFHLNDIFTRLLMVRRKKTARETTIRKVVEMTGIFNPHKECKEPKKVLIEGKPGMGKTTYCNKVAYDWATKKRKSGDCFPNFELVLLLKCGDVGIESDLWEAIDDQLLPREVQEEERNRFFEFICQNQSKILLVLDGLDELPESRLPEFTEIIQGKKLPRCHLVVTARHEAGLPVRNVCDTLLEIEGFTPNDAKNFILKYFKGKNDLSKKLLDKLESDKWLKEMLESPLNTSLLCLLCEDFDGILPESRTQLYFEIVQCVLMRYRKKKGLPVSKDDLIEFYKGQLTHLGSIALNGLREGNMYFGDEHLRNQHSDLRGFGVLSVQFGSSKRRPSQRYGFTHKSFQEFFAGLYLCYQLVNNEIDPEVLLTDTRYFQELRQVLQFACGLLAVRSEESAVALINGIANKVNKQRYMVRNKPLAVALKCIKECKKENSNFHVELARTFGTFLKVHEALLNQQQIDGATAAVLSSVLQSNATLTKLDLCVNNLGPTGAESLAAELNTNTTLKKLNVSFNSLSAAGAGSLASALKRNTTLTDLCLAHNNLCSAGAESLAVALQTNATLKLLRLSDNNLGPAGAKSLASALETNTTLTELDLSRNELGPTGAESLATALKRNKTLTGLNLSLNKLGSIGAESLAEVLGRDTTLTKLNLTWNEIGAVGGRSLAAALETNITLRELHLCWNNLSSTGAKSLAAALQRNTALTELHLSGNNLGPSIAESLASVLEKNTTLKKLNLARNELGPTGAESLAAALKINTTAVTSLNLSSNKLGPAGGVSFAAALETNRTLRQLNLGYNNLGLSTALFADALNINSTISLIILFDSNVSESVSKKIKAAHTYRIWV